MKGRALLLVLSVLVAAVGTGLIYAYVRSADTRAKDKERTVSIAIAQKPIPAGTSAAEVAKSYLTFRPVRQSSSWSDAIDEAGVEDFGRMTTSTAITNIKKDDPVLLSFFRASTDTSSAGDPTYVDVRVPIEGAAAGAGLVRPGAYVMVFLTVKAVRRPYTKVLLPKVRVVDVDGLDSQDGDGSAQRRTATGAQGTVGLSVPVKDAEQVILATEYKDRYSLFFGLPGENAPSHVSADPSDLTAR